MRRRTAVVFLLAWAVRPAHGTLAADTPDTLEKARVIAADTVKVRMEEPVLVDQASPKVKEWGPYRMPKVFRLPSGEICLTFSVGLDYLQEQGKPSPAFVSTDEGKSWRQSTFPHSRMNGMNPLALGRDTFLLAYSEFERPNANGQPAKAIMVRRVAVTERRGT